MRRIFHENKYNGLAKLICVFFTAMLFVPSSTLALQGTSGEISSEIYTVDRFKISLIDEQELDIFLSGPIKVQRKSQPNKEGKIETEIVSMDLHGYDEKLGYITVAGGKDLGLSPTLGHLSDAKIGVNTDRNTTKIGNSISISSNTIRNGITTSQDLKIDTDFEVYICLHVNDGDTSIPLHNIEPLNIKSHILTHAQFGTTFNSEGTVKLYDSEGDVVGELTHIKQGILPEPYLSYNIKNQKHKTFNIYLKDKISNSPLSYKLRKPVRFLNPATKKVEELKLDTILPNEHLVGYRVKGPKFPRKFVSIDNQFGKQHYAVRRADLLLVPSAKCIIGSETDCTIEQKEIPEEFSAIPEFYNDHYLCNKIDQDIEDFTPVDDFYVEDQFEVTKHASLVKPIRLCSPIERLIKQVDAKGNLNLASTAIRNPTGHLVCYQSIPEAHKAKLKFSNQLLQDKSLMTVAATEFCVPSTKVIE